MLPHTVAHYRARFPTAPIVILDNESTDSSKAIAEGLGCSVHVWQTGDQANIHKMMLLKNNVWKEGATTRWVIICDMDEWAEITEAQLLEEEAKGVTIINFRGAQMVGDSQTTTLEDIDLHAIPRGYIDAFFNKRVCFRRDKIESMRFDDGAHKCSPLGEPVYSHTIYPLKHLNYLGLQWLQAKFVARWNRTHYNRSYGRSRHYSKDLEQIEKVYLGAVAKAKPYAELDFAPWRP
jgi:hypothetical protein